MAGARERGQASAEWVALVGLVALALAATLAVGGGGGAARSLALAIARRIECAAGLAGTCAGDPELVAAYGAELAAAARSNAPELRYEDGMTALPVDFRECRGEACGNGPPRGAVAESDTGAPATAFVHAVDCRPAAIERSRRRGYDCSGRRAGFLYLTYWLYYENSSTAPALPGDLGYHHDDWEAYEVRIGPGGVLARATSHHGYDYEGGPGNWPSDAGLVESAAWGPATGHVYISGGSHAGHVAAGRDLVRGSEGARLRRQVFGSDNERVRWTPADRLRLVPLESLDRAARRTRFEIDPPWRKPSWRDPEA